jgi:drug/metabolite transporter (DMT)-like permease
MRRGTRVFNVHLPEIKTMVAAQRAMTAREWGLLALLSLLWGGSYLFVGVAVHEIPPLTLVTLRVGLGAALLWAAAPILGVAIPRSAKAIAALMLLGFGNNALPFGLITWSQTHLPGGLASILTASTPLFSVLLGHVLTKEEKLSGMKLIGAVAGIAGVASLVGPDLLVGAGGSFWAELAVLGAALAYALSAIFARRMRGLGLKPIDVATGQSTAATVILAPLALAIDQPWTLPMPSEAALASVLGIAALSTALAFVVYFRILAGAGATNVLLVTLLTPVSAVLLGALFLDERLLARQFLGFALIALGLIFIDGRLPRRLLSRPGNLDAARPDFRLPIARKSR